MISKFLLLALLPISVLPSHGGVAEMDQQCSPTKETFDRIQSWNYHVEKDAEYAICVRSPRNDSFIIYLRRKLTDWDVYEGVGPVDKMYLLYQVIFVLYVYCLDNSNCTINQHILPCNITTESPTEPPAAPNVTLIALLMTLMTVIIVVGMLEYWLIHKT